MPLFPSSAAFMIPWGEGSFGHCVRCKNCCPLTSDGRELWEGAEKKLGRRIAQARLRASQNRRREIYKTEASPQNDSKAPVFKYCM